MGKWGSGHIYKQSGAWHLQFYQTEKNEAGELIKVRRSKRLCEAKGVTQKHVNSLAAVEMANIESHTITAEDMMVSAFWDAVYLPYCEEVTLVTGRTRLKPSTVRGYKQIWKQHLKAHFGNTTLQGYEPDRGSRLLDSLTGTLNKTSLKHVRALGSSIFERARVMGMVKINPWKNVPMPKDAVDPENTPHYTPEQAEDLVTALVEHVDAQLVLTLACFLGLGPAEIAGLQWGDVDSASIHIRRNRIQSTVSTTKNKWRAASVPIIDQVRVPLELWRTKCETTADGDWLVSDLHNLVGRVIKPHVQGKHECVRCKVVPKASGVKWAGLYAGRRGAVTMVIEATGNVGVAQRLARHKTADTTVRVYNKGISEKGFEGGMQAFSKSLTK